MKKDVKTTDIICIIDMSGSMSSVVDATCDGFNEFIAEQRDMPGKAFVSLILFNDNTQICYEGTDIGRVPHLDRLVYKPERTTALLDAVGETLSSSSNECAMEADHTIVLIITDGAENASKEWTREAVRAKISDLQASHNWSFIFMGANQDSFEEARSYGINDAYTANFASSDVGTRAAYGSASVMASSIRSGNPLEPGKHNAT